MPDSVSAHPFGIMCSKPCRDDFILSRQTFHSNTRVCYTTPGYYFITINSFHREPYFGHLDGEIFQPSPVGEVILDCWSQIPYHFPNLKLDVFMLMPDHFHGILELTSSYGHDLQYGHDISCPYPDLNQEAFGQPTPSLIPTIIRTFKAAVTRQAGKPVWQRGYYEHIVRDYEDLDRIRGYIETQYLRTTE